METVAQLINAHWIWVGPLMLVGLTVAFIKVSIDVFWGDFD